MCVCASIRACRSPEVGDGNSQCSSHWAVSLPRPLPAFSSLTVHLVVLQFFLLSFSLPALSNSLAPESPCSWGCPQIPDSPASASRVLSYRCVPISLAPFVFNFGILFWYILKSTPTDSFLDLLRLSIFLLPLLASSCVVPFSISSFNRLVTVWDSQFDSYCLCLVWNATVCDHSQLWSCLFVCLVSHWSLGMML